jgi:Flp pilus assembly protein TadG
VSVSRTAARAGRRILDERGQALVEFALLAPVLVLILIGVIQVGTWIFTDVNLSSGTREAGRLLANSKNDAAAIADVENRLKQNLDSGIDTSKLQYSFSPTPAGSTPLWPTGTTVTLTVSYPDQMRVMGVPLGSPNMTASAQVRIQ